MLPSLYLSFNQTHEFQWFLEIAIARSAASLLGSNHGINDSQTIGRWTANIRNDMALANELCVLVTYLYPRAHVTAQEQSLSALSSTGVISILRNLRHRNRCVPSILEWLVLRYGVSVAAQSFKENCRALSESEEAMIMCIRCLLRWAASKKAWDKIVNPLNRCPAWSASTAELLSWIEIEFIVLFSMRWRCWLFLLICTKVTVVIFVILCHNYLAEVPDDVFVDLLIK
jgi:hypothetical protein